MTRVIIADPDPASRNALILWLVYKLGIDEIVQVADGEILIEQIEEEKPDVILMDWALPNRPSLEYFRGIQQKKSDMQWVILSVSAAVFKEAMGCTPWFLQKGSSPEIVFSLLQQVIHELNKTPNRL